MADGETIPKFARKLTMLVRKIRSIGMTPADKAMVQRLFSIVPNWFTNIVNTIKINHNKVG